MKFSSPASHRKIELVHNAITGSGTIKYTLNPHRAIMFLNTGNVTSLTGITYEDLNGNTGGLNAGQGMYVLPITLKSITVDKIFGSNFRLFILS